MRVRAASALRLGLGVALAGLAGACGDRGTTPVIPPDSLPPIGQRVELKAGVPASGTVTLAGRTGQFVIRGPVGPQVRLFLQARSGKVADTLVAAVKDSAGRACCWSVGSVGTDTSLTAHGTGWLPVAAGDPLYVDVAGLRADDSGAFTVLLYQQNPAPEKIGARFAVGDTVSGESIDVPGDVDEFYFTAQVGEELLLFLQAKTAVGGTLTAVVADSGGTGAIVTAQSNGPDSSLLGHGVAPFTAAKTGTYRLRVGGYTPWESWPFVESEVRGGYRFFIARLNRAPEHAPVLLAVGDTSAAEAIDLPGDIDEFSFDGVAGTELNVMLQPLSGLAAGATLDVFSNGARVASVEGKAPPSGLDDSPTGRFTLSASGRYMVRVQASGRSPAEATGQYRFELYRIDRRPEHAAVLSPIGTTVTTEALDRPGDIDEFQLPAAPGKQFAISFRALDDPNAPMWLEVLAGDRLLGSPAGTLPYYWIDGATPIVGYTSMIAAPDTGSYTVRVFSTAANRGRYTFEIYPLSLAPETLPASITMGVPVVGERIDRAMDVDTFTFAGTAGQYVNLFLRRDAGPTSQLHLLLQSASLPRYNGWWGYDMAQVSGGSATLDSANAGRIKLPFTGLYKVIADGFSYSESGEPGSGPYSFLVFPIDPRPEGRSAAIAIGDTVREAIYPSGDIDEYTFAGNSGDRLTLSLQADSLLTLGGLQADIVDPSGQALGYPFYLGARRDIDLALTGAYTIRVWRPTPPSWEVYQPVVMGRYTFALTRRP